MPVDPFHRHTDCSFVSNSPWSTMTLHCCHTLPELMASPICLITIPEKESTVVDLSKSVNTFLGEKSVNGAEKCFSLECICCVAIFVIWLYRLWSLPLVPSRICRAAISFVQVVLDRNIQYTVWLVVRVAETSSCLTFVISWLGVVLTAHGLHGCTGLKIDICRRCLLGFTH